MAWKEPVYNYQCNGSACFLFRSSSKISRSISKPVSLHSGSANAKASVSLLEHPVGICVIDGGQNIVGLKNSNYDLSFGSKCCNICVYSLGIFSYIKSYTVQFFVLCSMLQYSRCTHPTKICLKQFKLKASFQMFMNVYLQQ